MTLFQRLHLPITELKDKEEHHLFLTVKNYGRVQKFALDLELDLDLELNEVSEKKQGHGQGYLYFQYHTQDQLINIKRKMEDDLSYKLYFVCHRYFDLNKQITDMSHLKFDWARIIFLVSPNPMDASLYSSDEVKNSSDQVKYCEFFYPNKKLVQKKENQAQSVVLKNKKYFSFEGLLNSYLIIQLGKILLEPQHIFAELFAFHLNKNNVLICRFLEFFLFLHYCIYMFFIKSTASVRSILTYLYFQIRHLLLMSGFKSFGLGVDVFHKLKALFGAFLDFIKISSIRGYFFLRHLILMSYFKVYGFIVDSFYFTIRFYDKIKWILWIKSYAHVFVIRVYYWFYSNSITFFYKIRHLLVMGAIHTYYFIRKIALIFFYKTIHFVKTVLLFPFFKTYWFLSYQYRKRIKKEIH